MFLSSGLLLMLFLPSCAAAATSIDPAVNAQIDVFGVQLNMSEGAFHELITPKVDKAMCIYGYEYNHTDRQINVGFAAKNNRVRRISTKNSNTSIYGIIPGISVQDAFSAVSALGFKKDTESNYRFAKGNLILTIISLDGTLADGISIEIKPD